MEKMSEKYKVQNLIQNKTKKITYYRGKSSLIVGTGTNI